MALQYFEPDVDTATIMRAMRDDGACVLTNVISDQEADLVLAELQPHFDKVGRFDESDFNGYSTLRVSSVLGISPASVPLVEHPRVIDVGDELLLPNCHSYRIGSLTAIQILPGETRQVLHTDDGIYPMRLPGVQLQFSALWSLCDFTAENGATRVYLGSHKKPTFNSYGLGDRDEDDGIVQAIMPKGSVLFYMGTALHGGGANETQLPRTALINTYALGWLRQEENQILNVPRETADGFSDQLRRLMGYSMCGTLGAYQEPDGSWVRDLPATRA